MIFATSGDRAIEMMSEQPVDVLVSDMRMPGMDGAELLRIARERWPETARFVLSGYSDAEAIMRSTLVAHQFLSKPCDGDKLRATVERAIALQRLIDDPAVRRSIGAVEKLPSVPETYRKLTKALASEEVGLEIVARIVARDPAISAKLLQLVNSAFFGLSRTVSDIAEAVSFLGLDVVRDLTLTLEAFTCSDVPSALQPALHGIADRSFAVASVAREIAEPSDRDAAYTAGLLLDVGYVVIAARMPEAFSSVAAGQTPEPRTDRERREIGADHAAIGAFLLSEWGLPTHVTSSVAWHHEPAASGSGEMDLAATLNVADALTDELTGDGWNAGTSLDTDYLEQIGAAELLPEWREAAQRVMEAEKD